MTTATKIKKGPFIGSAYEGDTLLDIHGYDGYFEEIYIALLLASIALNSDEILSSNTEINICEIAGLSFSSSAAVSFIEPF